MASLITTIHPMTNPADTASGGSENTAGGTAAITANDFLTLLVNELKNQDPTAQTDPNEYINQLVQVNSLQQLIQINENLSAALGASGADPATGSAVDVPAHAMKTGAADAGKHLGPPMTMPHNQKLPIIEGNLSVPQPTPAAQRVAQALGGR